MLFMSIYFQVMGFNKGSCDLLNSHRESGTGCAARANSPLIVHLNILTKLYYLHLLRYGIRPFC